MRSSKEYLEIRLVRKNRSLEGFNKFVRFCIEGIRIIDSFWVG